MSDKKVLTYKSSFSHESILLGLLSCSQGQNLRALRDADLGLFAEVSNCTAPQKGG